MSRIDTSHNVSSDSSFSGFLGEQAERLSRRFTEVSLLKETATHQLFRAKRFGRWYLLKSIRLDLRQSEFHRQMLHKEMEILMQLQHPGIVGCYGMEYLPDYTDSQGETISVGECIVLEYIDGQTLFDTIKADSSFPTLHPSFISELLDALAYMHATGITHRDLKPSNIMVTHNGQHVKIIDFSLADTNSHAILKQPSGTRHYMAPEQETMTTPDVRNDIYSLGVILQEINLRGFWPAIARRCQFPIEQRYANIADLRADVARYTRRGHRLRWTAILLVPLLLVTAICGSVWHTYKEQYRIPRLTSQAMEQLEDSIAATQLTQHIDTLSKWCYLDPHVNEKILGVNAFIYEYAETNLPDCSDRERTDILCHMLDRWQQWHDHIVRRAKFLMNN